MVSGNRRQTVLLLQGGGALGAFQAGVYEALEEARILPDWVVGTSIGAINGALIAGNPPRLRLARLREFWEAVSEQGWHARARDWPLPRQAQTLLGNLHVLSRGVPGFFSPRLEGAFGWDLPLPPERASYYDTTPLRLTLEALVDFDLLNAGATRLSVGAVRVRGGEGVYFDSGAQALGVEHIMASGALPPGFPPVRVDGDLYWDGGLSSNTPLEFVLEDNPRRDSLCFLATLWNPSGGEPGSLREVLAHAKDIQYASRARDLVAREQRLHELRHVINALAARLPEVLRDDPAVRALRAHGCASNYHLVRLQAPLHDHADHTRDIDFAAATVRARWQEGLNQARAAIARRPWARSLDADRGVFIHEMQDQGKAS
ncbi:MAG: patatin-like phospholipase family protein [Betaproteobacteria bacterium]|nr:patatin-like phospholipase family protein [Betaproteobacteria bacterium]